MFNDMEKANIKLDILIAIERQLRSEKRNPDEHVKLNLAQFFKYEKSHVVRTLCEINLTLINGTVEGSTIGDIFKCDEWLVRINSRADTSHEDKIASWNRLVEELKGNVDKLKKEVLRMGRVLLTFKKESIGKIFKENRKAVFEQWEIPIDAKILQDVEKVPNQTDSWGIVFEHDDIPEAAEQITYTGDGEEFK